MLEDFLLGQRAAVDGEIVHQRAGRVPATVVGTADGDGVVADTQGSLLGCYSHQQAVHIEADVVLRHVGIIGERDMMPLAPLLDLKTPGFPNHLAFTIHRQLGADSTLNGEPVISAAGDIDIPAAAIFRSCIIGLIICQAGNLE